MFLRFINNNITEEMIKINEGYFVNQTSCNDCGLACLTMILKFYGVNVTLAELKKEINIGDEKASVYDLIKFSKKKNIEATGYKNVSIDNIKTPCIVHLINDEKQHFVVVIKVLKNKILVADPASRIMYVSKSDFLKKYTGVAIMFEKKSNFLNLVIKNKSMVIKILMLSIILTLLNVLFSFMIPVVINIIGDKSHNFNFIILGFLFLGLSKDLASYFKSVFSLKFQLYIDKFVTIPTISKIINLPHVFYHYNGSGELISKINDLSYIKDTIFAFVEIVILNVLVILFSLLIMFFINHTIFIINLFLVLLLYFINKSYIKNNLSKSYELQRSNEKLSNKITDVFGSILTVKNLAKEKYFTQKITNTYKEVLNKYNDFSLSYQKKQFLVSTIITIITIFIVLFLVNKNETITTFLLTISLQTSITNSALEIFKLMPLYANFKNTYLRINEIYNKKELIDTHFKISFNHIHIKNIKYSYGGKKVLNGISFDIKKGDWVMVNGPTGSGKSTMFKLLTKQIPYDGDSIYIDNTSISSISEEVMRNTIVYVDQKIKLINGSIKDNIFMGDLFDERAVSVAMINDMLKENKINYDYQIDNTNSNLSGGQISKIAIAQAFNSKRDLIIFDETTSNLDSDSEAKILRKIKQNYKDKTIILITHRKSNAEYFNKIITFKDGKIIKFQGG